MSRRPLVLLPGFSVWSYLSATLQVDFHASPSRALEENTEMWLERVLPDLLWSSVLSQSPAGHCDFQPKYGLFWNGVDDVMPLTVFLS